MSNVEALIFEAATLEEIHFMKISTDETFSSKL